MIVCHVRLLTIVLKAVRFNGTFLGNPDIGRNLAVVPETEKIRYNFVTDVVGTQGINENGGSALETGRVVHPPFYQNMKRNTFKAITWLVVPFLVA